MTLSDEKVVYVYLYLFTLVFLQIPTPLFDSKSRLVLGPIGSLTML